MKPLLYFLLTLLIAGPLVSCKKFLEIKPKNAVSDEQTIYDQVSAETALRGVYRQLASAGYYGETFVTIGYFAGGDVTNNTTGGGQNLVDANFRSDDLLFNTSWAAIYGTINRANIVLDKVAGLAIPDASKNTILGEAYFIRALAYFDLAKGWGGVQLLLKPTASLDVGTSLDLPRSTLEATYNQIAADLDKAESLLPESLNRIRATKKTVRALRARLFLYRSQWQQAETEATKLIKDESYKLVFPFSAWFANNVTATQESILELQYSATNQSALRAQMQHPTRGGTYRYFPNTKLVSLLRDPAIGSGKNGRRALIDSIKQGTNIVWQGNLYYRNPATDPTYILRIAEQYLIRAEARAQLGLLDSAKSDLNKIRQRASIAIFKQDTLQTQEALLLAIENERRFEFLWEGHRWFDLARTGRAKAVLEAQDPKRKVDPWENLFPIPVSQLQLDKSLTQNPGY